jgi:hypothetical protein
LPAPSTGLSFTSLRIGIVSYVGIAGAVFTIVGNLDAAYKVARLARILFIGLVVIFSIFQPIAWLWKLQTNPKAFSTRLVRIVAGVGLVIALNYSLLWAEQQAWIKELFG